ncbi:MAG: hypothetical protein ACRCWO_06105 [Bosea sp. (in: a-proteobacteria)]
MFSIFFSKRLKREHLKLIMQTEVALHYFLSFTKNDETANMKIKAYQRIVKDVRLRWAPGKKLNADDAELMLDVNQTLRSIYTKIGLDAFKDFDGEFEPLGGWNEAYRQVGL